MEAITVERSIWIHAPRERVWQALTEPAQLEQWFLAPALGAQLKRDDKGTLSILMGPMSVEIAMYETFDPPRRVTSRSLPDQLLATTYRLETEQDGTRVTVTMTGFEALPEDAARERLEPSARGWEKALENLKAYIDGASLPHPEGVLGSIYGYRRETAEKLIVERSIWIAASRERVWQAITDPAQIQQWFSPGTQWRGTGLHVGGRLSVYNPETESDMYVQVIDVVDPPHRLVTHSEAEAPEISHVTRWTLEAENGGTRLTISHSGYELEALDARHNSMEQNAFGFGMMLENLKAQLEGESLPYPGGF